MLSIHQLEFINKQTCLYRRVWRRTCTLKWQKARHLTSALVDNARFSSSFFFWNMWKPVLEPFLDLDAQPRATLLWSVLVCRQINWITYQNAIAMHGTLVFFHPQLFTWSAPEAPPLWRDVTDMIWCITCRQTWQKWQNSKTGCHLHVVLILFSHKIFFSCKNVFGFVTHRRSNIKLWRKSVDWGHVCVILSEQRAPLDRHEVKPFSLKARKLFCGPLRRLIEKKKTGNNSKVKSFVFPSTFF